MRLGSVPLLAGMLVLAGCAPALTRPVIVNQETTVVVVNLPAAGPVPPAIDPHDPRIAAAGHVIADMVGHPVTYEVDAALAASFGSGLHEAFVAAMEATVDGLRTSRARSIEAYAFSAPILKSLSFVYSPTADNPPPTLDPKSGNLRVVLSPHAEGLLSGYDVIDAFADALRAHRNERYTGRAAEAIPPGEQRAYFEFLTDNGSFRSPVRLSGAERSAWNLQRLAQLLRLYDRIVDPSLRPDLRKALIEAGAELGRAEVAAQASWPAVQAAFVRWLNAHAGDWDAAERRKITDLMVGRPLFGPAGTVAIDQGFDPIAFARPIFDRYLRAGGVLPWNGSDETYVAERVICPHDGNRSGCAGIYPVILALPQGPARLAAFLSALGNERVTRSAMLDVLFESPTPTALSVIDAFSSDERMTNAALRAVADFGSWENRSEAGRPVPDPAAFIAYVRRLWPIRPRLHGALLYGLTEVGRSREGLVAWGHLTQVLGGPISADDLGAFLDQGPRAFSNIDIIAKGLGPGWARAPVVVPRFEAWLNSVSTRDEGRPESVADLIVESFCESGSPNDITIFQGFLRSRVEAYPAERRLFVSILESKVATLCPAGVRKPVADQPVLFGD